MNKIYLITLVGQAVFGGRQINGFMEANNEGDVNRYIEEHYNITLGSIIPNKFAFQNGCHWEYTTNKENVDVHIDIVYNIKEEIQS